MAQYNKEQQDMQIYNDNIYEVVMLADAMGQIGSESGPAGLPRYAADAWGRPKSVIDRSLFSATWTYDISERVWEEWAYSSGTGWTPQSGFTNASSENFMLNVKSTDTQGLGCTIASKAHPKYEPNRGHLYSTAVIQPNATDNGLSRFGLGSPRDGCFFEIEGDGTDWDIFVSRRYNGTAELRESVKSKVLELFPDFDPEKGHVYDIQFQWRGVGNYYFFIDLQLVYAENVLGTRNHISMADPALQAFYSSYCFEEGTERVLKAGCIDITSEGGNGQNTAFGSINSGDTLFATGNSVSTAIVALKVPRYITYGNDSDIINSRGAVMDALKTYCSKDQQTKVWYFRDTVAPNLEALTWTAIPDSRMLKLTGGVSSALDTAFQADKSSGSVIVSEFAKADAVPYITNESKNSPFNLTPGDILVFSVKSLSGNASATLYYSEEI